MSDVRVPKKRLKFRVLFWLWILLAGGNLIRAAFHLAVRDDLWGLAVATQGGLGVIFLGLAQWA